MRAEILKLEATYLKEADIWGEKLAKDALGRMFFDFQRAKIRFLCALIICSLTAALIMTSGYEPVFFSVMIVFALTMTLVFIFVAPVVNEAGFAKPRLQVSWAARNKTLKLIEANWDDIKVEVLLKAQNLNHDWAQEGGGLDVAEALLSSTSKRLKNPQLEEVFWGLSESYQDKTLKELLETSRNLTC